jgi:hypothetical protein
MVKEVARGITAHGRSKSYHRRGLWAIKAKNGGQVSHPGCTSAPPPPPRYCDHCHPERAFASASSQTQSQSAAMALTPASPLPPQFPVHPKQEKAAAAEGKAPKFYPSEDAPVPLKRRNVLKPARLRPSITPGTVGVHRPLGQEIFSDTAKPPLHMRAGGERYSCPVGIFRNIFGLGTALRECVRSGQRMVAARTSPRPSL